MEIRLIYNLNNNYLTKINRFIFFYFKIKVSCKNSFNLFKFIGFPEFSKMGDELSKFNLKLSENLKYLIK